MVEAPQVFISIVIATYNRPDQLLGCLHSLTQQLYPMDRFEVIVVDDGGSVPLAPIAEPFLDCLPLYLIVQENAGCGVARNTGAAKARGQYLTFLDDDSYRAADWLSRLEGLIAQHPQAMLGGHTYNSLPDNLYSEASQIVIDLLYKQYNRTALDACLVTGGNMIVPRDAFLELDGFDSRLRVAAEDRGFCEKWLASGRQIVYDVGMPLYHSHALNLVGFWKQAFVYGRGAYRYRSLYPQRAVPRNAKPGWYLYVNLLVYFFRPEKRSLFQKAQLQILLILSQVATVAGYLHEWAYIAHHPQDLANHPVT